MKSKEYMETRKIFGIQLSNKCMRSCSHCCIDTGSDGYDIPYKDFINIISGFYSLKKNHPEQYDDYVALTGGEPLFYHDNGYGFGDIAKLIYENGFGIALTTRGWTTHEQENMDIHYKNFLAFADERRKVLRKPYITVSFDTYTFNGNGDSETGIEMAKNAISSFLEIDALVDIQTVSSIKELSRIIKAVLVLMQSMEYYPFSYGQQYITDHKTEDIIQLIQNNSQQCHHNFVPNIYFRTSNNGIYVYFMPLFLSGRAKRLNKTSTVNYSDCAINNELVIRCDQSVLPCCSTELMNMPAAGSVKEETLQEIIEKMPKYIDAVEAMENDFKKSYHMTDCEQSEQSAIIMTDLQNASAIDAKEDICSFCSRELKNYL
ncbi:MAG: radical SAM protein [Candidatus Aenigmarchaeota archaeon]|nr:radical SAM protein [Candidatus Aenigmarchaeota archaeon]